MNLNKLEIQTPTSIFNEYRNHIASLLLSLVILSGLIFEINIDILVIFGGMAFFGAIIIYLIPTNNFKKIVFESDKIIVDDEVFLFDNMVNFVDRSNLAKKILVFHFWFKQPEGFHIVSCYVRGSFNVSEFDRVSPQLIELKNHLENNYKLNRDFSLYKKDNKDYFTKVFLSFIFVATLLAIYIINSKTAPLIQGSQLSKFFPVVCLLTLVFIQLHFLFFKKIFVSRAMKVTHKTYQHLKGEMAKICIGLSVPFYILMLCLLFYFNQNRGEQISYKQVQCNIMSAPKKVGKGCSIVLDLNCLQTNDSFTVFFPCSEEDFLRGKEFIKIDYNRGSLGGLYWNH